MKEPIASLTDKDPPGDSVIDDLIQISDFVMLELETPFDPTKSVAPACLPTKGPSIYYVITCKGGAQCVELALRWHFCVHGSICHAIYI